MLTSRHASTIALEKAQGKALEGHPSYNRKIVADHIRGYLQRNGIDPGKVIIAGAGRAAADDDGDVSAASRR